MAEKLSITIIIIIIIIIIHKFICRHKVVTSELVEMSTSSIP